MSKSRRRVKRPGPLIAGDPKAAAEQATEKKVVFNYIKSQQFRVVHVDGAMGGPAPRGKLFVNIYSERIPIPQKQVFKLNSDATLGAEIEKERVTRPGIVRETEVALVMDLTVARSFAQWLTGRIADMDRIRAASRASKKHDDDE